MSVEQVREKLLNSVTNSPEIKIIHDLTTRIHAMTFEILFSNNTATTFPLKFPFSYCSIPQTSPEAQRTFLMNNGYKVDNPFTSVQELLADLASLFQYRPQGEPQRSTYDAMVRDFNVPLDHFIASVQRTGELPPPPKSDASWQKRSYEHLNRTISIEENSIPAEMKDLLLTSRLQAVMGAIQTIKAEQPTQVYQVITTYFSKFQDKLGNLQNMKFSVDYTPANSQRITKVYEVSFAS